jgi:hypothetical protein
LLRDACRNEGARDGEGVGAEAQQSIVAISSSERSYEIEELQHGAVWWRVIVVSLVDPQAQEAIKRTSPRVALPRSRGSRWRRRLRTHRIVLFGRMLRSVRMRGEYG